MRGRAVLAVAVGPLALALAVVLLGLATPGYDASAETVSALAAPGRPWAWPARALLVAYGACVVAAAPAIARRAGPRRRAAAVGIAAFGIGAAVAGCAPKGVMGTPPTTSGFVHVVAALVAVSGLLVAMWCTASAASSGPERVGSAVAIVVVVVGSAWFRQTWGTEWYGVAERVVLLASVCWLSAEAVASRGALRLLRPPAGAGT